MSGSVQQWHVIYTKPRWEKKVYASLMEKGVEAYCPLTRIKKKWSDRMKWVEEPLFKSYVFLKITEEDRTPVRMVNGVVNFVYWLGKPAIVKEKEIEIIRKFLNDYQNVWAEPVDIRTDDRIRIRQGALMDKEATVMKVMNNRVQVIIESIGYSLVAIVDKSNVVIAGK